MNFSKLSQNEKLAFYGAIVVFLAGLISNWGGVFWLAVIAAAGMAVVIFLPQFAPTTSLPGSKGTLMATLGIVALGAGVIEFLRWIGYIVGFDEFDIWVFLVALVGAAVMAWAGWQELQREGGKWVFGSTAPSGPDTAAASTPTTAGDAANAPPDSTAASATPVDTTAADAAAPDATHPAQSPDDEGRPTS
jgi:hypothetical protein